MARANFSKACHWPEVLFPRSSMSQNRGFTRGFVGIESFFFITNGI